MGDRKAPTPVDLNQIKPAPPPRPPFFGAGAQCSDCGFRYYEHNRHIIPCPVCGLRALEAAREDASAIGHERIVTLTAEIAARDGEIKRLTIERDEAQQWIDSEPGWKDKYNAMYESLRVENQTLNAENERVNDSLASSRAVAEQRAIEINSLKAENDRLKEGLTHNLSALQKHNERLKGEFEQTSKSIFLENDSLRSRLAETEIQFSEALEEILSTLNSASEERYQCLNEWEQAAEKWKREGDMYGWNFHQGMAAGANWTDLLYQRIARAINAIKVRIDAAKEGKERSEG